MKKLNLYPFLGLLLLAIGWLSARAALSGAEPYIAATAGIVTSTASLILCVFLHGRLKLVPPAALTGGVLYLLFWKLTDTDLVGTAALLFAYAVCIGAVFVSLTKPRF